VPPRAFEQRDQYEGAKVFDAETRGQSNRISTNERDDAVLGDR
jgi:hypothetical protein